MKRLGTLSVKSLCINILFLLCVPPILAQQDAKYSVNFDARVGAIKPVNGVNLWAKFSRETLENRQADAEACHFSTVRLHDVPWDNEGMRLVDVHQIFGNLNANPKNPDNYFFAPTDGYIANIRKGGAVPIYRLGTSIEHTTVKYFAKKPQDFDHYAEICAGIVRHYNAGWANGFEWNLPYWEIWNEPNIIPQMWDDPDWDSYCRFYVVVAKRLRAEFPDVKIGGPALAGNDLNRIKRLADLCKEENAPLDFVSWHCYAKKPEELIAPPFEVRKTLDAAGFPNAELHLNEWHYFPTEWNVVQGTNGGDRAKRELATSPEGLHGAEAAAFVGLVLTRWQDGPLDMGNYYSFSYHSWGMIDNFGKLRSTYYAFLLFGEQISQAPNRVETKDPGAHVSLLGSVDETGAVKRLLVSYFKQDNPAPISISLQGVPAEGEAEVVLIDYDSDYKTTKVKYSNGILTLNPQKSSVFLVRF